MNAFILAAEEGGHHVVNPLFMDPFFFGVLAITILVVLVVLTSLFRNMSASHPQESEVSPYQPYVHPGHATHD